MINVGGCEAVLGIVARDPSVIVFLQKSWESLYVDGQNLANKFGKNTGMRYERLYHILYDMFE